MQSPKYQNHILCILYESELIIEAAAVRDFYFDRIFVDVFYFNNMEPIRILFVTAHN